MEVTGGFDTWHGWGATKCIQNFGGKIFWTVGTWKTVEEVGGYMRMYLRDVSSQYG